MTNARLDTLRSFRLPDGTAGNMHALAALEEAGLGQIARLPVSLRILLESVVRHCDGHRINDDHVKLLAGWQPNAPRVDEVPFVVARILLQDLNGVPLLADLVAMRDAAVAMGKDPSCIAPQVRVDMVIDHSIQVDHTRSSDALIKNMRLELQRNEERYRFMKWGAQAFDNFNVIPPGVGICHQVNLERLASGVFQTGNLYFPDTVVCPDSHTTMINGIGILGWGVGGIEAEAGMLGQPVYFLLPDVVGVELTGHLPPGITATDAVLTITERLRQEKVVGAFVEFFGEGAAALPVPARATIANMAPEYGAFIGFFPMDESTIGYFRQTGRATDVMESYLRAQGLFGMPKAGDIDYTRTILIDLGAVEPSLAGPRRPQDRIALSAMKETFETALCKPLNHGGFGIGEAAIGQRVAVALDASGQRAEIGHGDVLIAAITSCTNTSNPEVMIAAGLLARNAVAAGLRTPGHIKTSMAPGSRAVTHLLNQAGLLEPLAELGFDIVGYGCTTCIGNSGPLDPSIERALESEHLIACAVLSGNRNFEARIHGGIKANYLASPPLVVAFALAGRVDIDLTSCPIAAGHGGQPVYLHDIWPSDTDIANALQAASGIDAFRAAYDAPPQDGGWQHITTAGGSMYGWPASTYLAKPPFVDNLDLSPQRPAAIRRARALAIFGDSLTTDHISPAGEIRADTPAGEYLKAQGVRQADFNTYGARRGNHHVMMRGTFANRRIKNLMLAPQADGSRTEGGNTLFIEGTQDPRQLSIYDAAMRYAQADVPTIVFGGVEYGTGSARDWAAKGTRLLGVKAVIVASFERIHRSNLVLMGVLPLEFEDGASPRSLELDGTESYDILGLDGQIDPQQSASLRIQRKNGVALTVPVRVRLDTAIEVEYYRHGGIVPYVLRQIFSK